MENRHQQLINTTLNGKGVRKSLYADRYQGIGQPRKDNKMDLKDLCKIMELLDTKSAPASGPWEIGKKYFIRTVTMHLTGELTHVFNQELVFKDAAWIADSGRFHEAIKDPSMCNEVEPFAKPVIVGRGSIVDATEIPNIILEVK